MNLRRDTDDFMFHSPVVFCWFTAERSAGGRGTVDWLPGDAMRLRVCALT
jgi:hypothetical protein